MALPRGRRTQRSAAIVAATSVVAAAMLIGCGGDDSTDASGAEAATTTVEVDALDNSFRPETIEVATGTEVVWTNRGRHEHDVVPVDGNGWGVALADFEPGDVYRHTFDEPGEYRYYCTIHATPDVGMIGTVIVTD